MSDSRPVGGNGRSGLGLVSAAPGGPAEPMGRIAHGPDDQHRKRFLDLVDLRPLCDLRFSHTDDHRWPHGSAPRPAPGAPAGNSGRSCWLGDSAHLLRPRLRAPDPPKNQRRSHGHGRLDCRQNQESSGGACGQGDSQSNRSTDREPRRRSPIVGTDHRPAQRRERKERDDEDAGIPAVAVRHPARQRWPTERHSHPPSTSPAAPSRALQRSTAHRGLPTPCCSCPDLRGHLG